MTDYRPVSLSAVISAVFALASVVSFLTPFGLGLILPSLACAAASLLYGRRHPTAGRRLAVFSVGVCCWLLINVPVKFYLAYTHESPTGYTRVDFAENAKDKRLDTYLGKPVCFKGFPVINVWSNAPVTELMFSPNGSRSDTEHSIAVQLRSGTSWRLYSEPLAVSGILVRNKGEVGPKYLLQQAVIRKSKTPFDFAQPAGEGC